MFHKTQFRSADLNLQSKGKQVYNKQNNPFELQCSLSLEQVLNYLQIDPQKRQLLE